jgi:HaeII restriction endonuclease
MNITAAKKALDKVIRKGRVHFYKPFQIAEILKKHRNGEILDLLDNESYKNSSRRWRNEVSNILVGRICTSSARYQDDVFNHNACPPEAISALGDYNMKNDGEVEAYIYNMFAYKLSSIASIHKIIKESKPETFSLNKIVEKFETIEGLATSIDKIYEITVYALFSTIVKALKLEVTINALKADPRLINDFGDFLERVVGLKKGTTSITIPANLFRIGATNAADTGLDLIANFGLAVQVKHLRLTQEDVNDICEGLSADKIVIVCKDAEAGVINNLLKQIGLSERLQGLITFNDLLKWYSICLSPQYKSSLGNNLIQDFAREFSDEFPSLSAFDDFMESRKYNDITLSTTWSIPKSTSLE